MVDLAPQAAGTSSLADSLKSLSSEEITKFEKSFKDPKFMELLADYAKDIADPQTRAEQDQYIRQLEEEGRGQEVYGKGMQLVTPTAVFVAKTANKQSGQKIFINVCTSDKVVVATSKRQKTVDGTTKPGLMWDVPLMLGNQKEGSDRHRIQCIVFDFVVHPDTCRMALNNAKFKGMILDSAVDNIEKVAGWTLTRHYSFPKLAFKSTPGVDRPSTVSIRTDMQDGSSRDPRQENTPDSSNRQHSATTAGSPTLAKPLVTELPPHSAAKGARYESKGSRSSGFKFPSAKGKHEKAPVTSLPTSKPPPGQSSSGTRTAIRSGESNQSLLTAVATTRMEAVSLQAGAAPATEGVHDGVVQPHYEIVYRGQMELSEAWEDSRISVASAKCPKELVIRVKLLGVQQASQAQLNIQPDIMSLSVPGKYNLDLPLPYMVAEADGSASFNAAKQQLEVTLPVVPLPLPRTASRLDRNLSQQGQQVHSSAGETSVTSQPGSAMNSENWHGLESSSHQVSDVPDATDAAPQDVNVSHQASTSSSRQQQGWGVDNDSKGQRSGSQTQRLTKNQRKWLELHPVASTSAPSPAMQSEATLTVETVSPDTLLGAAAAGDVFVACAAFQQHIPGYVFTTRDEGLGYYKDTGLVSGLDKQSQDHTKQQSASVASTGQGRQLVYDFLQPRLRSCAAAEELD
ncbi:hypothetical protein WJX77_000098 [Trebouxia sp. C0004]